MRACRWRCHREGELEGGSVRLGFGEGVFDGVVGGGGDGLRVGVGI